MNQPYLYFKFLGFFNKLMGIDVDILMWDIIISGDRPCVLVLISGASDIGIVRGSSPEKAFKAVVAIHGN